MPIRHADPPFLANELPPLELRILAAPQAGPRDPRLWIAGIVALFILSWTGGGLLRENPAFARVWRPTADLPAPARPFYDRAMAGDTGAMRMLGTMYCDGVNMPRDVQEGMHWYRMAADAGNLDAERDLERLGLQ